MREKSVKKFNRKSDKNKRSLKEQMGSLFFTVIALFVAVVVFIGFMFLRSYFADEITYKEVFVVKTEIPEGEIITETNIQDYFTVKKTNIENAVQGAFAPTDFEKLYGQKAKVTLRVGEEVSETDFTNVNVYLDYIENPVQMSLATGDIAGTNGGKIRAGDIVNITLMFTSEQLGMVDEEGNPIKDYEDTQNNPVGDASDWYAGEGDAADWYNQVMNGDVEEKEEESRKEIGTLTSVEKMNGDYNFNLYARYMLENIYIQKVLTVDGVEIAPTDTESAAGIIVLVVPKELELELNNILVNCQSMRISKVLYEISPEDLYKDPSLKEEVEPGLVDLEEEKAEEEEEGAIEEVVLPEDGWTEVNENGLSFLSFDKAGVMHYVKDANGTTYEESCEFAEGATTCTYCLAEKPLDSVEGDEVTESTEESAN